MVSISLDSTFFIQVVLFLALVYLLNVFLYRPVFRIMEERRRRLADLSSGASAAEAEVEKRLAEYKARIDAAKTAGNAERSRLKKEGHDRETELLSAAHSEAQASIASAREKIGREADAAIKTLRGMVDEMGREISDKIMGRAR